MSYGLPDRDTRSSVSSPLAMTPIDHRRLRRLLQRERQKGVLAFDQLIDQLSPTAESAERDQGSERVEHDRAVGRWARRLESGPAR